MSDKKGTEQEARKSNRSVVGAVFGTLFTVIILFVGIGIIAALLANGGKSTEIAKQAPPSPIGTTVSDTGFNFVVNSIKCGETRIQTSGYVYTYSDAQGQFCRLNITITNNTNSTNSIGVSAQYLFSSKGQKFNSDSGATATAADALAGSPLNDAVNPGNSVTGDIIYDVPAGITPTVAEFHGDSGSLGARVNLQ